MFCLTSYPIAYQICAWLKVRKTYIDLEKRTNSNAVMTTVVFHFISVSVLHLLAMNKRILTGVEIYNLNGPRVCNEYVIIVTVVVLFTILSLPRVILNDLDICIFLH